LYNWTDFLICIEQNVPSHDFTLYVYNHAYRICWMFTNGKSWDYEICDYDKFENDVVRNHSWILVHILLTLNKFPLKLNTYLDITKMYPEKLYKAYYEDKVEGKSLSHSINFRIPLPEPEDIKEIDFAQAKNYVMDTMNRAMKLQEEYKEHQWQLQIEKAGKEEAERKIKALQEKLDVWENDAFYKAVNINSILKYAQDRGNCDNSDIKTIRMMLLALCANKVSNDVIEAIKTLKLGGNITIGEQHNHGCQQFYGNITDSEFPSK